MNQLFTAFGPVMRPHTMAGYKAEAARTSMADTEGNEKGRDSGPSILKGMP